MQNKPNFQDAQMNVNQYNKMNYVNKSNWTLGENKPNSNPINANQSQNKPNPSGLRCLLRSCRTDQIQFPINPIGAVLPSEYYQKTCFLSKNTHFYMRNSHYISKSLQSNNLHQLLTFRIFCIKPMLPILTKVLSNHSPIFTLLDRTNCPN